MSKNLRFAAWSLVLLATMGAVGCGEKAAEEAPEVAEVAAEEQQRAAEEARRQQETAALAERASALTGEAVDMPGGADFPEALRGKLSSVDATVAEVERQAAELQGASGEAWESAKAGLESGLADLEAVRAEAAGALASWREKEAEAAALRVEGPVIDPKTGLIEGLDGGEYDAYLVSFVKKLQERLRRDGLYAGPADGVFGRAIRKAVGEYQQQQGLPVSGVPSPITRSRLFADGG